MYKYQGESYYDPKGRTKTGRANPRPGPSSSNWRTDEAPTPRPKAGPSRARPTNTSNGGGGRVTRVIVNSNYRQRSSPTPTIETMTSSGSHEYTPSARSQSVVNTAITEPLVAPTQPDADVVDKTPDYDALRKRILEGVQIQTFGMSKLGAASLRGKAVVMQMVSALKLTPEQEDQLGVLSLMVEMQSITTSLTEADRALIQPMSEEKYDALQQHDRAVRKNTRWVHKNSDYTGKYKERVRHNRRLVSGVAAQECVTCHRSLADNHADRKYHKGCSVPEHKKASEEQRESYLNATGGALWRRLGTMTKIKIPLFTRRLNVRNPFLTKRFQSHYPAHGVVVRKEYADL